MHVFTCTVGVGNKWLICFQWKNPHYSSLLRFLKLQCVATVGKGANRQNSKLIQWMKVVVKCIENVDI